MPRDKTEVFGSVEAPPHGNSLSFGEENPRIVQALREYGEAQQRNETPNRQLLLARYSDVAAELAACLDALEFVNAAANGLQSPATEHTSRKRDDAQGMPQAGLLGDYQIIGEIGRGGMGVVYEAQQISLGRRVALKVLPFAAMLDPRQLTRFKNEAQAAATLDHPNIVSVFAIGCDRSVHYFAMQYVAGQTLAEVIRDLRRREGLGNEKPLDSATVSYILTGKPATDVAPEELPAPGSLSAPTVRAPQAAISTQRATDSRVYFQNIARLGIQAAEALDHAHQHGILHRDVKPGNLMIDTTGKLWVTDFGLARMVGDAGMTMTGDLVGTLRYMSPEQALAKRVVVDHRSDIYSLGATLYELLTLRPAFVGDDRQELLRQIAFDEPLAPRAINRAIPSELETITLKAMAKDPRDRYATAQDLADDLQRFLSDQPIHARRPSLAQIARKWSRRHRAVVSTAGVVATCALLVGAGLLWNERTQTLAALAQAQAETERAEIEQANSLAEKARADANLREAQEAIDTYLIAVSQNRLLDEPQMEPLRQELLESAVLYYQRFVEQNRDDPGLKAELAAAHLRLGHLYFQVGSYQWIDELERVIDIIEPLVEQNDDISQWKGFQDGVLFKEHRGGGVLADEQEEVQRVLGPRVIDITTRGIEVWEKLRVANPQVPGFAGDLAGFYLIKAFTLDTSLRARLEAKAYYHRAIANWERFPRHILGTGAQWGLGVAHRKLSDAYYHEGQVSEAHEHARRAVQIFSVTGLPLRLQPEFDYQRGFANYALACTAHALNRQDQARDAYREVTRGTPTDSNAHMIRGESFAYLNEPDKALVEFTRAIELEPKNPRWLRSRAAFHRDQGRLREALADFRQAIELQPAHSTSLIRNVGFAAIELGRLNLARGDLEAARQAFQTVLEFEPADSNYYCLRGDAFAYLNQPEKALENFNRAVEIDPQNARSWRWRAGFHRNQGNHREAIADYTRAIELDPEDPENPMWYSMRALTYADAREPEKALADFDRAVELEPNNPNRYYLRASFLCDQGQPEKALENFNRAVEIDPQNARRWRWRAGFHRNQGNHREAIADYTRAIELDPESPELYSMRALTYADAREPEKALADSDRAVELEPNNPDRYYLRASFLCDQARHHEAIDDFDKAVELEPDNAYPWYLRALACVAAGDHRGFQQSCAAMLEQFAKTKVELSMYRTAWTCALAPDAVQDYALPIALAEQAVAAHPQELAYRVATAALLYRSGQDQKAIDRLLQIDSLLDPSDTSLTKIPPAYGWYLLALAHQRLGNISEARRWYEKAAESAGEMPLSADESGGQPTSISWNRRATVQLLHAEAASALGISNDATEETEPQRTPNESEGLEPESTPPAT